MQEAMHFGYQHMRNISHWLEVAKLQIEFRTPLITVAHV